MKPRLSPDIQFVICLLLSVFFDYALPVSKIIRDPFALVGWGLMSAGIILVYWTNFILLRNKTSVRAFENASVLIISGPYSFSRNPIYLGMGLILFGFAVVLGSLLPFIFPVLFLVSMNSIILPAEEIRLELLFGKEYLSYKMKVRRWI